MFGLSVPWIAGIAAAAGLAAGFTGGLKWSAADLAACQSDKTVLGLRIEESNRAVATHKALSDKATAAAQDSAKQASEAQAAAQASDDARRAAIKANKGPQTCSAAIAAIRSRP
jgi:hypothetical protein